MDTEPLPEELIIKNVYGITIHPKKDESPESYVERIRKVLLNDILGSLEPIETMTIIMLFGTDDPDIIDRLAKEFNHSKEFYMKISIEALEKIRTESNREKIKALIQ